MVPGVGMMTPVGVGGTPEYASLSFIRIGRARPGATHTFHVFAFQRMYEITCVTLHSARAHKKLQGETTWKDRGATGMLEERLAIVTAHLALCTLEVIDWRCLRQHGVVADSLRNMRPAHDEPS